MKNNLKDALKKWKKSDLNEVSEAPILFRLTGMIIISTAMALTILSQ